ncbi:MAG: ferredoxin [Bacteroidia bacterium]|nr:ferredoxin [Bacteroidia bacterium]MBT8228710.1 ferredoxin [Bacteroidia bacterium]
MIQILFHRKKCIGCNACVEAAPDRWRVSKKDGRCHLIGASEKKDIYKVNVSTEEYDQNMIAAKNCPVRVIKIKIL